MTRRLHEPGPPDGWWWVRLSPSTPRGADRRWTVVRVLNGAVQPHGSAAWYAPTANWLRGSEWVPARPPTRAVAGWTATPTDGRGQRGDGLGERDGGEKARRVAAEIVDVFVGASGVLASYYDAHPDDRRELVAVVARLIEKTGR